MLDLIFGSQLGTAIAGIVALVIGAFGFAFKMRGNAIDQLEKDKKVEQNNNDLLRMEIVKANSQKDLQDDFNKATEAVIKSSDSDVHDRLSKFSRD